MSAKHHEVDRYDIEFAKMAVEARNGNIDSCEDIFQRFIAELRTDEPARDWASYETWHEVPLAMLETIDESVLNPLELHCIVTAGELYQMTFEELCELKHMGTHRASKCPAIIEAIRFRWKRARHALNEAIRLTAKKRDTIRKF